MYGVFKQEPHNINRIYRLQLEEGIKRNQTFPQVAWETEHSSHELMNILGILGQSASTIYNYRTHIYHSTKDSLEFALIFLDIQVVGHFILIWTGFRL